MNSKALAFLSIAVVFQLITAFTTVIGQEPYYYNIGADQFPVKEVYEVFQDSKGYIWIGSKNGLYIYNGIDFRLVRNSSLPVSSLSSIHEDDSGRIWVRNFRGDIFYAHNQTLYSFISWKDSIRDFPGIIIDDYNTLWVSSQNGLYNFDFKANKWSLNKLESENQKLSIQYNSVNFHKGSDSEIIATNLLGSPPLIIKHNKVELLKNTDDLLKHYNLLSIRKAFSYNSNNYLYSNDHKIFRVKNDSLFFVKDLLEQGFGAYNIYWLRQLSGGLLAVGTQNGLHLLDSNFNVTSKAPILKGNKISCVMEDNEGNIWLTSLNNGIYVIPNLDVKIYNSSNSSFPDNGVFSLATHGNKSLFIGFSKGQILEMDPNQIIRQLFNPKEKFEIPYITYSSYHDKLLFIHLTHLLSIPYSNAQKSPDLLLSAAKEIKVYKSSLLIPTSLGISLLFDPLDPISSVIRKIRSTPDFKSQVQSPIFDSVGTRKLTQMRFRTHKKARTAILDSLNHRIWAGYNDGLFFFHEGQAKEFKIDGKSLHVNKIEFSPKGMIWMATSSHGLIAIDDTVVKYSYQFPNPIITFEFDEENVWFSTIEGLFKLNTQTNELLTYNKYDGIASGEIGAIKIFNNKVYAGTPEGLITFPKNGNYLNEVKPRIEITGMAIWEEDTTLLESYFLKHDQNNIAIRINGISLKSMGNYTILYRMLGLNDLWIEVPASNNVVRFPSLPHGTYTFQVKSKNEDGFESAETRELIIVIKPPFWMRWWFHLLVVISIILAVSVFFIVRISYINKKTHLEKQLKTSEIVAIKAQMNPHFIFNALNSIQDLVMQKETRNSTTYLGVFSDLLRHVLEASGEEFIGLNKEIEILDLYLSLEKLRFEDDFNYEISHKNVLMDIDELMVPSMIIQPYVENAIKHGLLHKHGDKRLLIEFVEETSWIKCYIKDNGVGRVKALEIKARRSKSYKAFASDANKKRIDLINALYDEKIQLTINDLKNEGVAVGTEVIISLPKRFI